MSDNTQVRATGFDPTIPLALLLIGLLAYFFYTTNFSESSSSSETYYGVTDAEIRQLMAEYGCSEAEVKYFIRMTDGR